MEKAGQGKIFQNISAPKDAIRAQWDFEKHWSNSGASYPLAGNAYLVLLGLQVLANWADHLSIMYPEMPRANWERTGPRNLPSM